MVQFDHEKPGTDLLSDAPHRRATKLFFSRERADKVTFVVDCHI